MSILLVEDNDFEASLFQRALRACRRKVRVLRVRSLREAKTRLYETELGRLDTVFVDQHLPDGLGTDLAGEIKRNRPAGRSAVFMLTCDVSDATRAEALANDTDGYLTKPVRPERLREILDGCACHWKQDDLPRDLGIYRRRMGIE